MRHTVKTSDGRLLAVEERGDPAGWPILVHHGTPSSRQAAFYGPWARDAAERGLRLISYDRPGYGDSSPRPGGTVADTADDVRAICAELAVGRLGTWGFSGGGPHVLACAALLPDLVTAAVALAGMAPFEADGLDWFAGMYRDEVEDTQLFLTDPDAARQKMEQDRTEFLLDEANEADWADDDAAWMLARDDSAVMQGRYHRFLSRSRSAGMAPGIQGWWDDIGRQVRPWGFDVAGIDVPVLLMYGRRDIFVPLGHGSWLAGRIPGVEARWFSDEGHGSLARKHLPAAHAWLSERR